jgi:hypothetical protein
MTEQAGQLLYLGAASAATKGADVPNLSDMDPGYIKTGGLSDEGLS